MSRETDLTMRRAMELDRVDRLVPSAAVYTPGPGPTPPVVSGSRGGNAALASLLTALDTLGIIDDQTT